MERVLAIKANALAAVPGYEVHIIAAALRGRKPCFPLDPAVRLHDLGVRETLQPCRFRRRLDDVLKNIRPDVVVSLSGRELAFLHDIDDGSAKIAEFHFSREKFFMEYGSSPFGRLYASFRTRRLEKQAARLDRFVVLTKEDRDDWAKVVPGAVQIYNPLTFNSEEKSTLEAKRCIAVGRLTPQKNFSDLIKAWGIVVKECPGWTLDIFGEGLLKKKLSSEIAAAGLTGAVRLIGRTDDICREMLASSCLAMTSRYEGFPMALLEAAGTGLPMVSYSCPKGPAEIIRDGKNGFLVPPGDIDTLAKKIIAVIKDPELRKNMGREAALTAKNFTLDSIIPQWTSLFEGLIKSTSK